MENQINKHFSHKVTIVSFSMSILVIYIHSNNLNYYGLEDMTGNIAYTVIHLFGETMGAVAVPFFFMMSGYWLFRFNVFSENSFGVLRNKLRKKVKSLLVPYLFWDTFGMVFYMGITRIPLLAAQMNNGEIIPVNAHNLINGIFLHEYYFTFWYCADLILLTALSPILLHFLRNKITTGFMWGVFAVIYFFNVDLFIFSRSMSPIFFFTGGILATYYRERFEEKEEHNVFFVTLLILFLFIQYFEIPILNKAIYLLSPIVLWRAIDALIPEHYLKDNPGWFTRQSFFIYAAHVIPVTIVGHLLAKIGKGSTWAAISYLIAPWITLGLIYVVAQVLYRNVPRFYRVICGDRA